MNSINVEIKEVDEENWYSCCTLELAAGQEQFMEPNAVSIAQSKFEPLLRPYAIYADGQIAGFLMYNSVQEELDGYWIYRIMVDKGHQGKGIGKAATELMIERMENETGAARIVVGYHPDNKGAHQLYAGLGFVDRGDRFGKEMAVVKELN